MRTSQLKNTWKNEGVSGIGLRSAVYFVRRIGWRAEKWSTDIDNRAAKNAVLKRHAELLQRNEVFRAKHRGRRCFVIGNGPSLKHQDLAPLSAEITFVTNFFHRHHIIDESWQPTYYCLSDPAFFDGREPLSSLEEIVSRITRATFFVPHYAYEFLQTTKVLPPDRTFYIASCEGATTGKLMKPDLTQTTHEVQTVVQLSITAAMFMGCSPIYLLGLDHDWLSHGGNHLNFYSKDQPEKQPDGNLPGWTYHAMMDAVLTMWRVYELQQSLAEAAGIKIFNATRGGFLDVFERADYDSVIAVPQTN